MLQKQKEANDISDKLRQHERACGPKRIKKLQESFGKYIKTIIRFAASLKLPKNCRML